jgi:hypothetical protein
MFPARQKGGRKILITANTAEDLIKTDFLKTLGMGRTQMEPVAHLAKGHHVDGTLANGANDLLIEDFAAGLTPFVTGLFGHGIEIFSQIEHLATLLSLCSG